MITTTFIIATVAYIVFNFAFAFVWNLGIFKKQYETLTGETAREKPIIPLGFLAIVIQALALSTLFALFYSGTNPITGGLFFGLLLGSYSIVYGAFVVPAKFNIEPVWQYAVLELAYGVLHFSIAGIIVAYVFS
ncbi:hypothetical protein A3C21_03170 [Candidatus Kaiserbacteria bacterium RIFCSPHIGHO2_02_FULL_59_21]|uniref:DUF1761 domain-containing protein n=2 Tax=Candidatus Kaiseribacteriota TaxID=1752734 RepID=A0A0G2AWS3_9BACT|nr:MAG: hypothetical protein UY98_C0034G0005 [Candidatus Kaiserbacteria bacterium GW2011_GWA2_58_9]OGG62998.1 MAG: hypothetical protein A2766_00420 [Candidatus Kaiserbacteria bacterium RIFCSPHIGHO2_01_FULL_58_22]OGG66664.1 MAG: hypothetical protein A3C21_03170 [Candidatus Kaiserbacteria bacterium RIFCSPHIGHO2_02_FULL_59_21]OGG78962.1 MAG: hypothetical protein A2952_01190 [Candidatus Kaiserbacteria bacterium RIFCSPLOWO2_01_FULL_59_34]OGG84415.1 MAG: hypothetical protein A3I47_02020 [Candidatus K